MCVECLIGKQKKPILFKVTEPSSIPYRTLSACAKRAAYPDPPPVILLPESRISQAADAETLLPGSAPARNVSRYWGSPRAFVAVCIRFILGLSAAGANHWLYVRLVHAFSPCRYSMASLGRAAAFVVPVKAEAPDHTL